MIPGVDASFNEYGTLIKAVFTNAIIDGNVWNGTYTLVDENTLLCAFTEISIGNVTYSIYAQAVLNEEHSIETCYADIKSISTSQNN